MTDTPSFSVASSSEPGLNVRFERALRLFRFEDRPYTFTDYRPLFSMFQMDLPTKSIWKTGRQSGKSLTIASFGLFLALTIPNVRIMYAVPLYDQAKAFSRHRIGAIIRATPGLQRLLRGSDSVDAWDEKIFANGSSVRVTYVLKNVMRVRGESSDFLNCDEFQEFDTDMLTIVESCLAASHYHISQYTGTPLTTTNISEEAWASSSMGEWAIPCHSRGCKKVNISTVDEDLIDMIGKKGPVCASCGKPIDPNAPDAHWEHRVPARRSTFVGRHVSHPILATHYAYQNKWQILLDKQKSWPTARFHNEVLGEACDVGLQRLTAADVRKVSILPARTLEDAANQRGNYDTVVLGADWGGKGWAEGISRTAYSIIGRRKDDFLFDQLWYRIFDITSNTGHELEEIDLMFSKFRCSFLSFDFGADPAYEYLLSSQTSIPEGKIMGLRYMVDPTKDLMKFQPEDDRHPRGYFSIDKTRSLLLLFEAIKRGLLRFPKWESFQEAAKDLLAFEDTWSTARSDVLILNRRAGMSDDLAAAVNYALCTLLYASDDFGRVIQSDNLTLQSVLAAGEKHG